MIRAPRVCIIATGSEITSGKSQDTNSGFIANELFANGVFVQKFLALPDDPEIIYSELKILLDHYDPSLGSFWVILTGGLGPTDDDYTLEVVSRFVNQKTIPNEKARIKLETIFQRRGKAYEDLLPHVIRQIHVPEDSRVLDNKVGIAPGFIVEPKEGFYLACMPGVPPEMKEMFQRKLKPEILRSMNLEKFYREERTIWNLGESYYQENFVRKNEYLKSGLIEWGVTAKRGYIKVTFLGPDQEKLKSICADLEKTFPGRVGGDVFNDLHKELLESKKTIALSESCTGGWIAKTLTDMPGSSGYFISSLVTYHNQAKENLLFVQQDTLMKKGAVSPETAKEMLDGLEKHFDVDFTLSITGIAGPDGGSEEKPVGLVYIGTKAKNKEPRIEKYLFPGNRETIREASMNNALFQLLQEIRK